MSTGMPGAIFIEATGTIPGTVVIGNDGFGDFRCDDRSIAVWVQQ